MCQRDLFRSSSGRKTVSARTFVAIAAAFFFVACKPSLPQRDVACKTDGDCELVSSGFKDDPCCSSCDKTAASASWVKLRREVCRATMPDDYFERCPHLSCAEPPEVVAACVAGECKAVEVPQEKATIVVDVPWSGDAVAASDDCPNDRRAAIEAVEPLTKIEVSRGGIAIREIGTYEDGAQIELEVSGCTHETATFTFRIDGVSPDDSDDMLLERGKRMLKSLALKERGPIYRDEILEAFEKGTREPPNAIYHNATIIYDVEREGKKGTVSFHYDFAL